MTRTTSRSVEETVEAGRAFAKSLGPGAVVALSGTLGSGKTRFVVGICEGLGVRVHATSPTFTIINEYPSPVATVAHIDMYRIRSRREVAELGIEEYFSNRFVCLIEWPEQVRDLLPPDHFEVAMEHGQSADEREIVISRAGEIAQ